MSAELAAIKATLQTERVEKSEVMSKVSSGAFAEVLSVTKLVLVKDTVAVETVEPLECSPFTWPHESEERSTPSLIDRLQRVVQLATIPSLELVDARRGKLQYSFSASSAQSKSIHYIVKGFSDAAFVRRDADENINMALDLACALVDFKTTAAMAEQKEDSVQRQVAFQALSFHARTGRSVPVVATDLVGRFRVWILEGSQFIEFRQAQKKHLSLSQGCGLLRKLLIEAASKLASWLSEPRSLFQQIGEDSDEDTDEDSDRGNLIPGLDAAAGTLLPTHASGPACRGQQLAEQRSGLENRTHGGGGTRKQSSVVDHSPGAATLAPAQDENAEQEWHTAIKTGLAERRLRRLVAANLSFLTGEF
jgi:hypothetical protein